MQRDEAPEIWSLKRVGGPTEGVGDWMVAMETAAKLTNRRRGRLQAPSKEALTRRP